MDYTERILSLFNGTATTFIDYALGIVAMLIVIVAIISLGVSIYLAIKYVKFNKTKNSADITGIDAARKILDANGLQNIKVKSTGSLLFGNSYSHYFKKVRLRRLTKNKTSISSLAMGAQKASLAILDKENDPDMKTRIRLVPLITFGPFMFVPLLVVGVLIDILLYETIGTATVVCACLGIAFFIFSLILSIVTLKTEVKAQNKAKEVLKETGLATASEIAQMEELFKLYNIEYINDIILSALELLYYVLQLIGGASSSVKSNS